MLFGILYGSPHYQTVIVIYCIPKGCAVTNTFNDDDMLSFMTMSLPINSTYNRHGGFIFPPIPVAMFNPTLLDSFASLGMLMNNY